MTEPEVEWICGENYDHDAETTYEDDEIIQWRCNECGAEGEEDRYVGHYEHCYAREGQLCSCRGWS